MLLLLPLLSSFSDRKYYKRLRQSLSTFWAVMMITRNTIKRRHWKKVDETQPTLATLLCHKHPLIVHRWQLPKRTWFWLINTPPSPFRDNAPTFMFGDKVSSFCKRDLLSFPSKQRWPAFMPFMLQCFIFLPFRFDIATTIYR